MKSLDEPGRRVLVVDDNEDVARSLALLLRVLGYRVEVCHNGPEALASARVFNPEIALLDLNLPGMDGAELARQLRQALGGTLRLVALSGDTRDSLEQRTRADFDYRLLKPVELTALRPLLEAPLPQPSGWV